MNKNDYIIRFFRTIECDCGLTMSRDQNAAINIKKEGLRILKSVA